MFFFQGSFVSALKNQGRWLFVFLRYQIWIDLRSSFSKSGFVTCQLGATQLHSSPPQKGGKTQPTSSINLGPFYEFCQNSTWIRPMHLKRVGCFLLNHPSEKICSSQIGVHLPPIFGMNIKKYLSCHHLVTWFFLCFFRVPLLALLRRAALIPPSQVPKASASPISPQPGEAKISGVCISGKCDFSSREWIHIPPNGKFGKSSTQKCHFVGGYMLVPWRVDPIL